MEIRKYRNFHRMTPEHDIYTFFGHEKYTFLIRYVMKTISRPPAQPHTSPDHPEYRDEILHYNRRQLPDILHHGSQGNCKQVLQYYGSLACITRRNRRGTTRLSPRRPRDVALCCEGMRGELRCLCQNRDICNRCVVQSLRQFFLAPKFGKC